MFESLSYYKKRFGIPRQMIKIWAQIGAVRKKRERLGKFGTRGSCNLYYINDVLKIAEMIRLDNVRHSRS